MTRLGHCLLFWMLISTLASCGQTPDSRPNILVIMADDMGVNDLGVSQDGQAVTPTLDRLKDQGLYFQRHYADTSCAPSRVALLTGQHPARHGFNPINIGISPEVKTLPELLRDQGYSTHHIGKWHVGSRHRMAWPLQQGFDSFFGFLDQFQLSVPDHLYEGGVRRPRYNDPWLQRNNELPQQFTGHLTDLLGTAAEEKIRQLSNQKQPWFLNLWFLAPHTPIQPAPAHAQRFPDTDEGRYLALVAQLDTRIASILRTLQKTGQQGNTIVVFLSDNGGTNQARDNNHPHHGHKATTSEGAMRVPLILHWPGKVPAGQQRDDITTQADLFATLLTAAGATVPEDSDGMDLLAHRPFPQRPLFWESDNWFGLNNSLLSADGKWRLDDGALLLLHGATHPSDEAIQNLQNDYRLWRDQVLQPPVRYTRLSAQGHAWLDGHSFMRAPGYQGFSLKLAFQTDGTASNQQRTLLYQAPWWHIWLDAQGYLHAQLPGMRLRSPEPVSSHICHELVVSSLYIRQLNDPSQEKAIGSLILNNQILDQKTVTPPLTPESGWTDPTWIGSLPAHKERFHGWISQPILRKEYLSTGNAVPADKQVSQMKALCPTP